MRRLVIGLTALAVLWSGWWVLGAFAIERGVAAWLDARRIEGWQAQIGSVETAGFPMGWNAQLQDIDLTDPEAGVRILATDLTTKINAYWPLAADFSLPATPITIETPQGKLFVKLSGGKMQIALRPGYPAELQELRLTSAAWQLNAPQGNVLSADDIMATVTQDTLDRDTYQLTLDAGALTPGDAIRIDLGLPANWPRQIERFALRMSARLDQDAMRQTKETPVAALRQLDIKDVELIWGTLAIGAAGGLSVNAQGVPDGTLTLLIKNWRDAYEIAKEIGVVEAKYHLQSDLMLGALSNIGGDPNTLDLTLSFKGGKMFLGPIDLGPAPLILF